jgi:outer membrane autotransporter protein
LSLEWYLQSSLLATDDYPAALTGALLSFNADWGAWAGSFEDSSGVTIDLSNTDSLRGEIAARFESNLWNGGLIALDAGLRHEFLGEQQAEVSGLTFTHELPGTSGFIAAALNLMLDETFSFTLRGEAAGNSESSELNGSLSFDIQL